MKSLALPLKNHQLPTATQWRVREQETLRSSLSPAGRVCVGQVDPPFEVSTMKRVGPSSSGCVIPAAAQVVADGQEIAASTVKREELWLARRSHCPGAVRNGSQNLTWSPRPADDGLSQKALADGSRELRWPRHFSPEFGQASAQFGCRG